MRNLFLLFIVGSIFVCSGVSCRPQSHFDWPRRYKIKNNSSTAIYWGLSYSYPDTNVNKIEDKPYNGKIALKINSKDSTSSWTAPLAIYPTLQLFIFEADVIETTPWDSIVKHYMILKRYQYTEHDLRKANWTITYP